MTGNYVDVLPPAEAVGAKKKRPNHSAVLPAIILAAILFNGGIGFFIGMAAGEHNAAAEAEQQITIVEGERDNAAEQARQYQLQYWASIHEIAELKGQIDALENRNADLEEQIVTVSLEEPDPDTYSEEFGWNFDFVVRVVGAEARGEPFGGILAVAQCIKVASDLTGMTPEEVVKSPDYGYAEPVGREVMEGMEMVNEACLLVFGQGRIVTFEPIEYFYSTEHTGYSEWHEKNLRFVVEIGNHRFFARS